MSIFREYDIRGIYPQDLDQNTIFAIGYALGEVLLEHGEERVFVGYDAREHSPKLCQWLSDGLGALGIEVFSIAMVPTPVAYFCTFAIHHIKSQSSIMITGSHNPPEYNGFKITIKQKPFYGKDIQKLAKRLQDFRPPYQPSKPPRVLDALTPYVDFLTQHFSALKDFHYPIALDYGNGVGALAMSAILKNLNIQSLELFKDPDGTFPNHHPDPSEEKNLTQLKTAMREKNLPIALAFDGDADRIALLTSHHSYKGDELGILFSEEIAKKKPNPIIIGEVKCSQLMYDKINALGQGVMYKTGHSNLKVKLKELNADLAVEMSGHLFFADRYFGYDDAIYAGLRALELFLAHSPQDLEAKIASLPKLYNTNEEKIPVQEEEKFNKIAKLQAQLQSIRSSEDSDFPTIVDVIDIDGVRVIFQEGWGLVRASNTTPFIITRFEAKSPKELERYKSALLHLLAQC